MGCDIHMWAEILRTNYKGEMTWDTVGNVFPYDYYREDEPTVIHFYADDETTEIDEWNRPLTEHPYHNRNYDLFAILAGVRNGSGFAGSVTGEGFTPISPPRGIPDDASAYYRHKVDEYGVDGHSHSWVTLKELHAFDWHGQRSRLRGVLSSSEYQQFKRAGRPATCSSEVYGLPYVSHGTMDELIATETVTNRHFTEAWWEVTYAEAAGDFLEDTLPALDALRQWEKVADVRIVFFFDN